MTKDFEYQTDRVPTYEESIASTPHHAASKPPRQTIQQRNRLKRARLVTDIAAVYVEPAISTHLENGLARAVAVLLPSDAFDRDLVVTESSITSPSLPSNGVLLRLCNDEYKLSFLCQPAVVYELASTVAASLVDPTLLQSTVSNPPETTPCLPVRPQPQQRSSLRYMFGMADADKDPTGSTGTWNLGWRSEEDPTSTSATVATEEVTVITKLQDVSFRTESVMGLLESKSVKCIWCEVELKT